MKDGKLLGIINILDLAIILVIIATGVVLAPNFIGGSSSAPIGAAASNTTVYFTVEFPQTTESFAEKITVGDLIKDNARQYYYGKADKIEVVQATMIKENVEDGTFVEADVPGKVNVLLTVKCNGSENDKDIMAEGQPIKLGKSMLLKGKGYAAAGYVVGLRTEPIGKEGLQ